MKHVSVQPSRPRTLALALALSLTLSMFSVGIAENSDAVSGATVTRQEERMESPDNRGTRQQPPGNSSQQGLPRTRQQMTPQAMQDQQPDSNTPADAQPDIGQKNRKIGDPQTDVADGQTDQSQDQQPDSKKPADAQQGSGQKARKNRIPQTGIPDIPGEQNDDTTAEDAQSEQNDPFTAPDAHDGQAGQSTTPDTISGLQDKPAPSGSQAPGFRQRAPRSRPGRFGGKHALPAQAVSPDAQNGPQNQAAPETPAQEEAAGQDV
ncbi:MAG: hypothetical protein IJ083_06655 [Clostridia bacterium]|nr:hypothetical protein [Clostridia bacterium]